MTWALIVLACLLIVQQILWMSHTSELTNKLMSRDFTEYQRAGDPVPVRHTEPAPQDPPEDLRPLQEFTL